MHVKDNRVLEVQGSTDAEGHPTGLHVRHNGANQRWNVVYLDQSTREATEGLDPDFGFYRNRPFYIISRLCMRRFVEVVDGNLVISSRKDEQSQQFQFDSETKTLVSVAFPEKSIEIMNEGTASNARIWETNARWF